MQRFAGLTSGWAVAGMDNPVAQLLGSMDPMANRVRRAIDLLDGPPSARLFGEMATLHARQDHLCTRLAGLKWAWLSAPDGTSFGQREWMESRAERICLK